jgi:hypothetical protein
MTDKAIEAAARAIDLHLTYHIERDTLACDLTKSELLDLARAAAPALMEEGARLEREAIVKWLRKDDFLLTAELIEAGEHLPAAIVKGADYD